MTRQQVVVITGGTGFIGRHLVDHFVAAGWEVRAPARPAWELGQSLGAALTGADVIIHAAFAPYNGPNAGATNLGGSQMLLEEFRASGRGRFVFLSSMSAHAAATSDYGRDKLAIQSMLTGPLELALRPGLVLGEAGLFARIRRLVGRRRVVPVVGGSQLVQTIHVADLVAVVDAAISRQAHGVLTVGEERPVTFRTLLGETARAMHRRVLFVPVPFSVADTGLRLARRVGIRLPVSSDNLAGLRALQPAEVSSDLGALGVTVRDYRASLAALVKEA